MFVMNRRRFLALREILVCCCLLSQSNPIMHVGCLSIQLVISEQCLITLLEALIT
jgi:hypothetical protein